MTISSVNALASSTGKSAHFTLVAHRVRHMRWLRRARRRLRLSKPIVRKLQATLDPLRSEREVDRTAKLIGNEVANCARPKPRALGSCNRRPVHLRPFEDQMRMPMTVQPPLPPDHNAPIFDG